MTGLINLVRNYQLFRTFAALIYRNMVIRHLT
jgi:hypothetical protein